MQRTSNDIIHVYTLICTHLHAHMYMDGICGPSGRVIRHESQFKMPCTGDINDDEMKQPRAAGVCGKSARVGLSGARQLAFLIFLFLAGLVSSVQGYACSSSADCEYPGCNDNPCSSSASYCINGTWGAYCGPSGCRVRETFSYRHCPDDGVCVCVCVCVHVRCVCVRVCVCMRVIGMAMMFHDIFTCGSFVCDKIYLYTEWPIHP